LSGLFQAAAQATVSRRELWTGRYGAVKLTMTPGPGDATEVS
jgi:hypothetical protein